ncbi:hypothetical protein EJ02DRAFT_469418 [Clathrospora elynae]|uniref:Uncharacterized protein n=1 Tax=Clathrospora elynae TaxID=706981 RepID=A0A6A5SE55_9PLEO|nr:hypothetical protein EJ02DRAFT_469418 [Clathrospora elynae]
MNELEIPEKKAKGLLKTTNGNPVQAAVKFMNAPPPPPLSYSNTGMLSHHPGTLQTPPSTASTTASTIALVFTILSNQLKSYVIMETIVGVHEPVPIAVTETVEAALTVLKDTRNGMTHRFWLGDGTGIASTTKTKDLVLLRAHDGNVNLTLSSLANPDLSLPSRWRETATTTTPPPAPYDSPHKNEKKHATRTRGKLKLRRTRARSVSSSTKDDGWSRAAAANPEKTKPVFRAGYARVLEAERSKICTYKLEKEASERKQKEEYTVRHARAGATAEPIPSRLSRRALPPPPSAPRALSIVQGMGLEMGSGSLCMLRDVACLHLDLHVHDVQPPTLYTLSQTLHKPPPSSPPSSSAPASQMQQKPLRTSSPRSCPTSRLAPARQSER